MIKEIFEHRTIRKFSDERVSKEDIKAICSAASRASTCGNMQCYSLVVSQSEEMVSALSPLHFGQVERMNMPCVVTVCADVNRFSLWCKQRGAEPSYDNFLWFVNGTIDAVLAAQNLILEAESRGLGICVLGTTLYTAEAISKLLELPTGVIPITTIGVGHPAEQVELTDRLPLEAVVHYEKYGQYSPESIDELWSEKEAMPLTAQLLEENTQPTLAHVFTENRYKKSDNIGVSKSYFSLLKERGFFNN